MLKRTPLFAAHQKLGGRLIEFGGWEMPVQYSGIVEEHLAVRKAAGLFDISHMGEFLLEGRGALSFLNRMLTNDAARLAVGQAQYTLMCKAEGGVIDDLYLYRIGEEKYLLIVNASRIEADFTWLEKAIASGPERGTVRLENASDRYGAVAVQGPRVAAFIDSALPGAAVAGTRVPAITALKKNEVGIFNLDGAEIYVARTGYTGEQGFEVVAPSTAIEKVWNRLLDHGKAVGLKPAGLGARDTLRTEVCYPLYGHELNEETSPIEAGLDYFVALSKTDFSGRRALEEQKKSGPTKKLVAFKMAERSAPPRAGYPILSATGEKLGGVTSGTQSPSLNVGIGLGYLPPGVSAAGTGVEIEIRGRRYPGVVVRKPIYKPESI